MKKQYLVFILALCTGLALQSNAKADATQDFITKATVAGEFEIESSKIALDKSQDKNIKRFAQQMIDDHTKASDALALTLQNQKMQPPKQELDSAHQQLIDKLQALSGDDFNHQYVAMQLDAHKQAVDLFTDYSRRGGNAGLKDFAAADVAYASKPLGPRQKIGANKIVGHFLS